MQHSPVSNLSLLLRLLKLARPHIGWMALGVLLALITALANIGLLAVSGWFLASMAAAGMAGVTMNYFTPAGVIRFLAIVRTAGRYGERLVTHNATLKLLAELRVWFYRKLEPLAPAHLQRYHSGDLLSRIQADIDQLDNLYLRLLVPMLVALLAVPLVLYIISRYDSNLALLTLTGLLSVALLIPLWSGWRSQLPGQRQVERAAALRSAQLDAVQGMRELLIYGAEQRHTEHCQRLSDQLIAAQRQRDRIAASSEALSLLMVNLTVIASLWLLIPQVASGGRPPAELAMLALLILASFEVVLPMPAALEQLSSSLAAARRLFSLADQPPARPEPTHPANLPATCSIDIRQLSFQYPDQLTPALQQLNLHIQQGENIALIGPSGSGKTTLTSLLLGFWRSDNGQIQLGGTDINQLDSDTLRSQIAVVSQHPHLFAATVADNLRLARPDATDAMLDEACEQAGLLEFIQSLPDGYQSWLGETGQGLSGGQARRLAIAQALLKPAPILILDEPTEGLDPITEQAVIKALQPLLAERTVIMISHRPAMLQAMDRIYLFSQGQLRDQGDHHSLLASNDYYRQLLRYF